MLKSQANKFVGEFGLVIIWGEKKKIWILRVDIGLDGFALQSCCHQNTSNRLDHPAQDHVSFLSLFND